MEPAPITPALMPPATGKSAVEQLFELSEEETALRHRLELRVERALYRAAVVLQALHDHQDSSSAHNYLDRGWRNEQKVDRAWSEVEIALQELQTRQLYRSTHQSFDCYCQERFGSNVSGLFACNGA